MTTLPEDWRERIPLHWDWVPLRYVAKIGTGHTPDRANPEYWLNCDIPWVTAADLSSRPTEFEPLTDTAQMVSELGVANSAAAVHPEGTVMFCRTASVGLIAITGKPMATTQAFVTWTAEPPLEPRYLLYVLAAMRPELFRLAYGSTHMTIYMPDLEALRIPLPGGDEQRQIANFLDDQVGLLDRAIALRQRQMELSRERLEARLRRTLAAQDALSWLPMRRLGVQVTTGPFGTAFSASEYVEGGVPVINPSHIKDGLLHPSPHETVTPEVAERLSRFALHAGDLVVSRKGDIGRSALVTDGSGGWICGSDSIAIRTEGSSLVPEFAWHLLRLPEVRHQLLANSLAATMPSLNEGNLMSLRVPALGIQEQRRLAGLAEEDVSQARSLHGLLSESSRLLQERKQALISAAVTGQFNVTTARRVA